MSRPRKYAIYCDPDELHKEMVDMKATRLTNNKLGKMYQNIIKGVMSRPNFSGYFGELKEDMEFLAIHNLVKYAHNYNPAYYETNKNAAFSYCTQIVFQCFTVSITLYKKKKEKEDMYKEVTTSTIFQDLLHDICSDNFYKEVFNGI